MKIKVYRRFFFESILKTPEEESFFSMNNIISINSCYTEEPPFSEKNLNRDNLLILHFDELIPLGDNNMDNMFSEEHADKIIDFIKRIDRSMPLIIHCRAGISRSAAVGVELNDYINRFLEDNPADFKQFYLINHDLIPNTHVGKILRRKLFALPAGNESQAAFTLTGED